MTKTNENNSAMTGFTAGVEYKAHSWHNGRVCGRVKCISVSPAGKRATFRDVVSANTFKGVELRRVSDLGLHAVLDTTIGKLIVLPN